MNPILLDYNRKLTGWHFCLGFQFTSVLLQLNTTPSPPSSGLSDSWGSMTKPHSYLFLLELVHVSHLYISALFLSFWIHNLGIGRHFSEVESVCFMAHLLKDFSVHPTPAFPGETREQMKERMFRAIPLITLTPMSIPLTFRRRPVEQMNKV